MITGRVRTRIFEKLKDSFAVVGVKRTRQLKNRTGYETFYTLLHFKVLLHLKKM